MDKKDPIEGTAKATASGWDIVSDNYSDINVKGGKLDTRIQQDEDITSIATCDLPVLIEVLQQRLT